MSQCEHEFNSGFVSALGKFLGHQHQSQATRLLYDLRIYGASEHLYDLEIPASLPEEIKARVGKFVDDVFRQRLNLNLAVEEADLLFQEADQILQEIDRVVFKLSHVCSKYP